jgi:hypothetical protein
MYVGGRTASGLLAVASDVVGAALASAPPAGAELTAGAPRPPIPPPRQHLPLLPPPG